MVLLKLIFTYRKLALLSKILLYKYDYLLIINYVGHSQN